MHIPDNIIGSVVKEGEKYFFSSDCPVGIKEHIHICIKHHGKVLLFSTCSSQTDTAFRLAKLKGININTFPIFAKNDVNKFTKEQTYVNCNNIIEMTEKEFGRLILEDRVWRIDGYIDEVGIQLIAQGVKLSPEVERRIKDLF